MVHSIPLNVITTLTANRTLISIPIGTAMLENCGTKAMVGFLVGVLCLSIGALCVARRLCLGEKWMWMIKV